MAAFQTFMCSSETTGQGVLAKINLVWFIERQGCGATTADVYTVRVGPHAWWSHRLLTADAFPIPQAVEAAGGMRCASSSIATAQGRMPRPKVGSFRFPARDGLPKSCHSTEESCDRITLKGWPPGGLR
jgi:hypothetical protein